MHNRFHLIAVLLGTLLACQGLCVAQPATRPANPARPTPQVTRADLAAAYLRIDRMLQDHPPSPEQRVRIHHEMDRVAYHFFGGDYPSAIRGMNRLGDQLRGAAEPDLRSFVESIRVRVLPPIAHKRGPSVFRVHTASLYEVSFPLPVKMKLIIQADNAEKKIIFDRELEFRADAPMPSVATMQPDAPEGQYRVQLVAPDGQTFDLDRWFLVERSLDQMRVTNQKRLASVDTTEPKIYQAWIACHSRNALLTDRPSEESLAEYLADPLELARQVDQEIEQLLKGRDPYDRRTGEYFRAIPAGAMSIPARVYAPESVKEGKPLPLVIALHGAGADEAMFMLGYGAGKIQRLADRERFIVVAPNTYWVIPNPSALEGIVAAMTADYSIDRKRIYAIGHSLGAMAAAGMATRNPKNLAGAVLIAGGAFGPDPICPTLVIAAEKDPLVRAEQLRSDTEAARADGLPVEFRLIKDAGHVLVCGEVLEGAIEWLFQRRSE